VFTHTSPSILTKQIDSADQADETKRNIHVLTSEANIPREHMQKKFILSKYNEANVQNQSTGASTITNKVCLTSIPTR